MSSDRRIPPPPGSSTQAVPRRPGLKAARPRVYEERLISAATMALVIFSGVAFADCRSALVQAAMSAVSLTAVTLFRRVSPEHDGMVPA